MGRDSFRLARVEERLEFILEKKGWLSDYEVIRRKREASERDQGLHEVRRLYDTQKYARLKRIEEKLDFLLRELGIFDQWGELRRQRDEETLKHRHALALANDHETELKARARVKYANITRTFGHPVFIEGKWVYIDPPKVTVE